MKATKCEGRLPIYTKCLFGNSYFDAGLYRGYIGVILGLYWGCIRIMEQKMETTIL